MKMYCPVCFREISVTVNNIIRRHGFRKDRWEIKDTRKNADEKYARVDGKPCLGTGKTGISTKDNEPMIEELEKRMNNVRKK